MDDCPRFVPDEDLVEPGAITDIAAFQRTPAHGPSMALLERVVADRREPGIGECLADVAADVTRAAGDENFAAHVRYI
jgi:hypothetical protein